MSQKIKTLEFDSQGRAFGTYGAQEAEEPSLRVGLDQNGQIVNAYAYSELLDAMIDCTSWILASSVWTEKIMSRFFEVQASDKYSAAEDHDYFREGRGA